MDTVLFICLSLIVLASLKTQFSPKFYVLQYLIRMMSIMVLFLNRDFIKALRIIRVEVASLRFGPKAKLAGRQFFATKMIFFLRNMS